MTTGRRLGRLGEPRTLAFAVRLGLLGFCLVVAALDAHPRRTVAGAIVLVLAAAVAYLPARSPVVRRLLPTLEACIAAGAVIAPPSDRAGLLPYLLAPAFAAGLMYGLFPAITATGMAAFALLAGHLIAGNATPLHTFAANSSQWVLLALAVGLLTAWIRRLAADSPSTDQNRSYEAAYDLLSQLRTVSRQLAGGLDAVSLAQALLQSLRAELPYDRGAVFVRAEGGRLVPLALDGASFVDWDTSLADDTPLGRAWEAAGPTVAVGPLGDALVSNGLEPGPRSYTVLPLRMGDRTFGLVALEADRRPVSVAPAMDMVNEAALRLETALLFGEVRSIATSEERRRLAREIHDGIAQELASLGYAVDDLVAEASASEDGKRRSSAVPISDILRKLRGEITRMVSELRLSIFDLRSEVQAQVGLGSALSDYVRAVSVGTTFSVHVILDEAPDRLPIAVEAELLRIAQEAITNARKHAKAEHLWVTCRVDPPFAHLRVEDDGNGLGSKRHDSFGLEVMRERAARLGGQLTIGSRDPHGTYVDVRLGERRVGTDTDDLEPDASAAAAGFGHGTVASPQDVEMASAERRREDEEDSRDGRNSAAR